MLLNSVQQGHKHVTSAIDADFGREGVVIIFAVQDCVGVLRRALEGSNKIPLGSLAAMSRGSNSVGQSYTSGASTSFYSRNVVAS